MGNAVAEFLQPFGIDVDILVDKKENKDSKKSPPPGSGSSEKPQTSSTQEGTSTSKQNFNNFSIDLHFSCLM